MILRPTIHHRAYELAAGGESIAGIHNRLSREGYLDVERHLAAPIFRRSLRDLMRKALPEA